MILNVKTVSQLNRALENSFGNIKRDMNELKMLISSQNEGVLSLKRNVESVREESATKDKINVLKIKLGELNEDLKKVWDIEKDVKAMRAAVPVKKEFQQSIDQLQAKIIANELRLGEYSKSSASENQLKSVVAGINSELNRLANEIRNVEFKKDILSYEVTKNFDQKLGKRFEANSQALLDLRKEFKNYVNKDELKGVISTLNDDFDSIRKELTNMQKDAKNFVKADEVKALLKNINNEFDGISGEVSGLKKQSVNFVTVKQIKGLIDDISSEFDEVKKDVARLKNTKPVDFSKQEVSSKKDVSDLRKSLSDIQKSIKEVKNVKEDKTYGASMVMKSYEPAPAKKIKTIQVKHTVHEGKPYAKTYGFGNFLVVVAFLSLVASIASYYAWTDAMMNNFAIGAVASFVVGMAMRIFAVSKRR